jgi:hypothetical protein
MGIQEIQEHIHYAKRLGKGKGNRPIFVKFMTFPKKNWSAKEYENIGGVKD